MATWAEFAGAAPDLAERGARRLGVGVAYIATTARDNSPRLHPFTPLIGGGRLLAFIAKHTVKYHNLLRDPRCAIHAMLGEDDEEFMIIGSAVVADDWATRMQAAIEARKIDMTSRNDVAFEFMVQRVHWAVWQGLGTPEIRRVARNWRAGQAAHPPVEG
ncbi:MAG: pyridoxamine 5'-phosphate oxidase family protein [Dehalococcoidia bacterium]|nr:pyridoxamine 5'-phosphate oxidase family protein [Dehalococcoidia bacterium]